jgi:hypothetical protein
VGAAAAAAAAAAEHSRQPKPVLWRDQQLLYQSHFANIGMGLKDC